MTYTTSWSARSPASASARDRRTMSRTVLAVLLGATCGFAWYRFVGCRSGACPIGTNRYVSTVYGAFLGYLLSGGAR